MREPVEPAKPVAVENIDNGGCHTDGGLTVADLIAKIGGAVAERPRHHHAAPDAETAEPESPPPSDEQDDKYDAYALLSPAEYNYDLPDLDAIHRETSINDAHVVQTTVLPKTSVRPKPARLVETPDVEPDDDLPAPKRRRKHRAMLVAGRLVVATIAAADGPMISTSDGTTRPIAAASTSARCCAFGSCSSAQMRLTKRENGG